MVRDTLPSQDAFIHQIWNSYLKKYRRYAPDSMPILETWSEVKVKVTVTQWRYATICHPKMYAHSKKCKRYALDTNFLKTRSEVKVRVTVTRKWYAILRHPKIHPHTSFRMPALKNIVDMYRTRSETDRRAD